MKKYILFILCLAAIAATSGYLMANMSWIGRLGINLMHREYKFLKVWWQGALAVYALLLILFTFHYILHRTFSKLTGRALHIVFIAVAFLGAYFTWSDFSKDFSHHLLRSRFHVGAYLFWVGWILIGVFFLNTEKPQRLKKQDKR
jgi:hypothetical protein